MAKIIGTVKSISGKASITRGGNQVHALKAGEVLHENDIIQTLQAGAKVVLMLEGGRELTLNGNDQILLDESVFAVLEEGEVIDGKALHQLIADKLGNPEETAAGDTTTSDANAGAEYASRNDARGSTDSGGTFSDRDSSALGVNFNAVENENFAPEAFDDTNSIVEGIEGDDVKVVSGNVLDNDTDDQLPNPPADLDVTAVASIDSENPTSFVEGIFTVQGLYGILTLNAETGAYTYTVNDANKEVNALNIGDSLSEQFSYVVSDSGLSDNAILTITINGANDQPVVSDVSEITAEADGIQTFNGELVVIDPDNVPGGHTFQQTGDATVVASNEVVQVTDFSVEVDRDGAYRVNGNFDALAAGETATVTFTYTATDDSDADNATSDEKTVTLTVTGTNDQPVVSDVTVNGQGSEHGVVGYYDMEAGQGVSAQVSSIETAQLIGMQLFMLNTTELSQIDSLYIQNPSNWDYGSEYIDQLSIINNAVHNGMTLIIHDRFVSDGSYILPGGEGIIFHRDFTNDTDIEIIENGLETGLGGTINDVSLDFGNSSSHGYVDLTSLPLDAKVLMTNGNDNQIVTFSYKYGLGTVIYSTIPLDYYLNQIGDAGISDNMEIYAANLLEDMTAKNATFYETNGIETIYTGQLELTSDLDTSDTHTFQQFGTAAAVTDSGAVITGLAVTVAPNGDYTVNGNFDALAEGETATVTFQYVANDGKGFDGTDGINESSISEPKTVTLIVTGTNDAVQITSSQDQGNVSEDSFLGLNSVTTGLIKYSDIDLTDTHTVNFERSTQAGDYARTMGTFTVTSTEADTTGRVRWTYTIDNDAAQELAKGQSVFETYQITIDDGHGGAVTENVIIKITGTNDRPTAQDVTSTVVEGNLVADASDNPNAVYAGAFDIHDVDLTDTLTVNLQETVISAGHFERHGWSFTWVPAVTAAMVITGNATDIIQVDDTQIVVNGENFELINPAFNQLGINDSVTIQFNYNVSDGSATFNDTSTTKTVSITITGTNDAPVVHQIIAPETNEDAAIIDILLLEKISDVDTHDTLTVKNATVTSSDGHTVVFTLDESSGLLTINPDQFTYLAATESVDLTVNYQVFDGTVYVNNTATVKINGINDAPVAIDDIKEADFDIYTVNLGGTNGWSGAVITATGGDPVYSGNKVGVKGNNPDSNNIDNSGNKESVQFTFNNVMLNQATVVLSGFNTSFLDFDTAVWSVYNGTEFIASGTSSNTSTLVIDTGTQFFNTLIIGTPTNASTSDFMITSVTGNGLVINSDLTVTENQSITIDESYLLSNDSDEDSTLLNITNIDTSGTIGVVTMDADGNVTYDPAGRFDHLNVGEIATDTFTYTLSDGDLTDTATVTVNIIGTTSLSDSNTNLSVGSLFFGYDGGEGYDSVTLPNITNFMDVNFEDLSSVLHNIENLNLEGGHKTLTNITPDAVQEMTDDNNVLKISGEADDTLELSGFTKNETASNHLNGYNVYSGTSTGGAEITLHIDQDITHIIP